MSVFFCTQIHEAEYGALCVELVTKIQNKIGDLHLLKLLLRYTIFEKSFIKSVFDGKLIVNALTKRYY